MTYRGVALKTDLRKRWFPYVVGGYLLVLAMLQPNPVAALEVSACVIDERPWGHSNGPSGGLYLEVIDLIARQTGLDITVRITPLVRTLRDVETGYCQFTITSWHDTRSTIVTRGATFAQLEYGVIVRAGISVQDYAGLSGLTVAWARGLLIGPPFDEAANFNKFTTDGYDQAVAMTAAGRADAAAGSMITLNTLVRLDGIESKFGNRVVLSRVALALQFNKAYAETPAAQTLNAVINRLHDSGESDIIIARHFATLIN